MSGAPRRAVSRLATTVRRMSRSPAAVRAGHVLLGLWVAAGLAFFLYLFTVIGIGPY